MRKKRKKKDKKKKAKNIKERKKDKNIKEKRKRIKTSKEEMVVGMRRDETKAAEYWSLLKLVDVNAVVHHMLYLYITVKFSSKI